MNITHFEKLNLFVFLMYLCLMGSPQSPQGLLVEISTRKSIFTLQTIIHYCAS